MNTSIITGSIGAISKQTNKSIAETFMTCDCIVLVDTSGSMSAHDSRGGRTRYDVACDELAQLQNSMPGKIAVVSFSDQVQFCPAGIAQYFGGGTGMKKALEFVKVADVPGMQFILISDGYPDDPDGTIRVAKTFQNKISTIYVGPEDDASGRDFLARLAKACGGKTVTADRAKELKASMETLLLGGGR